MYRPFRISAVAISLISMFFVIFSAQAAERPFDIGGSPLLQATRAAGIALNQIIKYTPISYDKGYIKYRLTLYSDHGIRFIKIHVANNPLLETPKPETGPKESFSDLILGEFVDTNVLAPRANCSPGTGQLKFYNGTNFTTLLFNTQYDLNHWGTFLGGINDRLSSLKNETNCAVAVFKDNNWSGGQCNIPANTNVANITSYCGSGWDNIVSSHILSDTDAGADFWTGTSRGGDHLYTNADWGDLKDLPPFNDSIDSVETTSNALYL
jgi:peptidase inhibitor family I36